VNGRAEKRSDGVLVLATYVERRRKIFRRCFAESTLPA
jgi:hypothetical protein